MILLTGRNGISSRIDYLTDASNNFDVALHFCFNLVVLKSRLSKFSDVEFSRRALTSRAGFLGERFYSQNLRLPDTTCMHRQ